MNSNFDDVGGFHEKFGLDSVTYAGIGPRHMSAELLDFRIKFMHEELKEFEDAIAEGDDAKAFDALLDLTYVVMGTAHLRGYPWQRGWELVQEANMLKVRAKNAEESKRGSAYDVVKPPGWLAPNIERLLDQYGWQF